MPFEAFTGVSSQLYTTVIGSQYDCQDIGVEIAAICDEWRWNWDHLWCSNWLLKVGESDKLRPLWVATFHWTELKRNHISKLCTINYNQIHKHKCIKLGMGTIKKIRSTMGSHFTFVVTLQQLWRRLRHLLVFITIIYDRYRFAIWLSSWFGSKLRRFVMSGGEIGAICSVELSLKNGGSEKLRPLWVATFHYAVVKRKQFSK